MSTMGDENWVIQLDTTGLDGSLVNKVNNELNKLPQMRTTDSQRWQNQSIYRIPCSMKELCPRAYEPQTVSIGPYHHGERRLEAMEEHKQRAVLTFLERSRKPFQSYVNALLPVVEDLKDSYHQLDPKWKQDTEAFLKLMIVDGCFILEIMRIATVKPEALRQMGYARNDPVFSNHGKLSFVPYLRRDMLKLENQLPLLLLITLLLVEDGSLGVNALCKQDQLIRLILKFFSQRENIDNIKKFGACLHILDLYRKSMVRRLSRPEPKQKSEQEPDPKFRKEEEDDDFILSATKLTESGISIKRSTTNLNDISYNKGVLKLPLVTVDDMTESNYLNMMAFERFEMDAGDEVRSYVYFMSRIMNNAKDARLLQSCGIVQNVLGSDKAVANLFMSLSRDVAVDPESQLEVTQQQMLEYCQRQLPRWLAYAKHNYFTNPWVGLSVLAAIFAFALAGTQTAYAVLSYHKKGK